MNPAFVAATVIGGVIVVYCLINFWERRRQAVKTVARNAKLGLLRTTPITEQQAEDLRAERDQIKWESNRERILLVAFWICTIVVSTVVEHGRPKLLGQARQITARQQIAFGAVTVFYIVVCCVMARDRGKVSIKRVLSGMIGRSPMAARDRVEEIEAQLGAPRNQSNAAS